MEEVEKEEIVLESGNIIICKGKSENAIIATGENVLHFPETFSICGKEIEGSGNTIIATGTNISYFSEAKEISGLFYIVTDNNPSSSSKKE